MYSFLCKHKLVNTNQFDFPYKHSAAEYALISLKETIKKFLHDGEIACEDFIDLQKAFDTVNHEILLAKFSLHYGIKSKQNYWFLFLATGNNMCH